MDPRLLEAFLHEPHYLMGKRLRPLSPWHVLLLSAAEVPVFEAGKLAKMDAAQLSIEMKKASWACSRSYPDSRVKSKIGIVDYIRLAGGGLKKQLESWMSYLDDYLSEPEVCYIDITGGKSASTPRNPPPEPIRLVGVMMQYGKTEKEAWDTPIGAAKWYDAVNQWHTGCSIDFDTDRNREFREALKKKIDMKAM